MELLKVEGGEERWTTDPGIKPAGLDEELLLRLRGRHYFFLLCTDVPTLSTTKDRPLVRVTRRYSLC